MRHLPTSQKRAAPDVATVDVLAAALDRFRVAGNWSALHETMVTVYKLFLGDRPMPPHLLKAAVCAVKVRAIAHDKNSSLRHVALLARKDTSCQFLADLCAVCADAAHNMAADMNEPGTEDLFALEFLLDDMYRSQPKDQPDIVTRAWVDAGVLKSTKYLLRTHGLVVQGHTDLLRRFWAMAQVLDDAEFTSLVTEKDNYFQRFQDLVGWPSSLKATRERIRKLGVEWSGPASQMAAKVREAEARAQAEMSATVREAVARAEKAEAEIARLNAVVRQSLDKVLDMQSTVPDVQSTVPDVQFKADTVHATDAATAAAAPASAAPALVTANVTGRTAKDIIYVTGPGGVGKSTLARQLVAGQHGRVVEADGGDEWAVVESALSSTYGVLVVVSLRLPGEHFVAQCLERGHSVHLYHVAVDADAAAKVAWASPDRVFRTVLATHRASVSTAEAPSWDLWSVINGHVPNLIRWKNRQEFK
jgi:hypothetical protein